MENSPSKTEILKPLFLKAGIPLALSIAGFIFAKITAKKTICDPHENTSFDEEILGLRSEIQEVKKMELELKSNFLEVKVSESMLNEVKNMLRREISSMEGENGRFQNLVIEYLRLVEQLGMAKRENGMLRRKVKRVLLRNMREKSRIVRGKNMKIDEAEEEILRLCSDVEIKCGFVKKFEDEVEELQRVVKAMEDEKNELLMRLNAAENSDSSNTKIEIECVTKEEYNEVVKELERLREERATEIAEFIYLKWNNACLKHELMRNHEQEEFEMKEKRNHLKVLELNGDGDIQDSRFDHQEETCIGVATRGGFDQSGIEQPDKLPENRSNHDHGNSRRKKFIQKIKKWVEGNEHVKTRNEDLVVEARRSYSSA
ncbi:hypothetical protein M5689_015716 [Euphorbia peplus]|nr:hypothetical protein M5689_015716 [Euphorbia peplus]